MSTKQNLNEQLVNVNVTGIDGSTLNIPIDLDGFIEYLKSLNQDDMNVLKSIEIKPLREINSLTISSNREIYLSSDGTVKFKPSLKMV